MIVMGILLNNIMKNDSIKTAPLPGRSFYAEKTDQIPGVVNRSSRPLIVWRWR
jgi:hypothetical protein